MVFKIPAVNMEKLTEKIEKLQRKAVKLNCGAIKIEAVGEVYEEVVINGQKQKEYQKFIMVNIEGEVPKLNDWIFLATLEHCESGIVIRKFANEEVPEVYRTVKIGCDHCGINRRRKDTYLIRNDKFEYKQVGSGCLRDFLGHANPQDIARYCELLLSIEDTAREFYGYPRDSRYILTVGYISFVVETIKLHGWLSKTKALEQELSLGLTTANRAYRYMFPATQYDLVDETYPMVPGKETIEETEKVLEWIRSQETDNDYIHNLKTICSSEYIEYRDIGIAASLIPTYRKAMDKIRERENKKSSNYVGNIDEKIEIEVLPVKTFGFEGYYGVTFINKMVDDNGNIFVWKTGKDLEGKEKIRIKGTIKAHNEFRNEKQTELTRCKVL